MTERRRSASGVCFSVQRPCFVVYHCYLVFRVQYRWLNLLGDVLEIFLVPSRATSAFKNICKKSFRQFELFCIFAALTFEDD